VAGHGDSRDPCRSDGVSSTGIEQNRLTELKRELAKIEGELRRRSIKVETPPAE